MYKTANKYNIKNIITGGNLVTEGILPMSWRYDRKLTDAVNIKSIYKQFGGKKIESFPSTSIQKLVNNSFENTTNLEKGLVCPECKSNEVTISESRSMQNPPSDLILVVKRYQFGKLNSKKIPINIKCDHNITVSSWLDATENLSQEEVTYNLRSIICHNGYSYNEGHYKTICVEEDDGNITYHELNDDKHYVLSEEKFISITESDGYIFHYSQRASGNLFENNYHDQIVMGSLQIALETETSCTYSSWNTTKIIEQFCH